MGVDSVTAHGACGTDMRTASPTWHEDMTPPTVKRGKSCPLSRQDKIHSKSLPDHDSKTSLYTHFYCLFLLSTAVIYVTPYALALTIIDPPPP